MTIDANLKGKVVILPTVEKKFTIVVVTKDQAMFLHHDLTGLTSDPNKAAVLDSVRQATKTINDNKYTILEIIARYS